MVKAAPHFRATVDAKALAAAAKRSQDVLGRFATIPILMHALLRFDGEELLICATDLDRSLATRIPAEGHGEVTVPVAALAHAASVARSGAITLSLENGMLYCRRGNLLHKMVTLPVEDFPIVVSESGPSSLRWTIPSGRLKAALSACSGSMETGRLARPYCHGICFHQGVAPFFYSSDGHRLCRVPEPALYGKSEEYFIVPAETIPQIESLCGECDEVSVNLSDNRNSVTFTTPTTTLWTKLMDAQPPEYERVIPKQNGKSFKANTEVMLASIECATPADRRDNILSIAITKDGTGIHFIGHGESAYLTHDACQIFDAKGCEGARFAINAVYLKWALSSLGAETVTFTFESGGSAFVLTGPNDGGLRVVMPFRANESDFAEIDALKDELSEISTKAA